MALTLSTAALPSQQRDAETWHLSEAPIFTLGGPNATGPTELTNVYAAAFWAGRVAILDGGSQTIRLFDAHTGRHLRTVGRKGQGPGEYQNAAYLQPFAGDSLFVGDIQLSRFTILDPDGSWARTVSLAALARETRLTPLGRFRDGSILAWAPRFADVKGPGLQRLWATIYRVDPSAARAHSIRVLPFATVQPITMGGGQGWRAALGAGQMQPAVTDETAYLNSPTQYLVHVYRAMTGAWSSISEPRPARLGTDDLAKRLRAEAVEQGASPEFMARVPVVDTLPAIRWPLLTPTGRLWLVDGATDTLTHQRGMSAYTAAGRAAGRLYIPQGFYPLAITDSLILLGDRESEGSIVRLFALHPPSR